MKKKFFSLIVFSFIIITLTTNGFSQLPTWFADSSVNSAGVTRTLGTSFDDTLPKWPTSSSSLSFGNPVFDFSSNKSATTTPFSFQTSSDLKLNTYTGSFFATASSTSANPVGSSSTTFSTLSLPWVSMSTNMASSVSAGMAGMLPAQTVSGSIQYQVTSKDTPYDDLNPHVAGMYLLHDNAAAGFALDKVLGDTPLYTASGQKYYGTASYYNPYSSSGTFMPEQRYSSTSQVTTVGGVPVSASSYTSSSSPSQGYYPGMGDYPTYYYGAGSTGMYATSSYPTVIGEAIAVGEGEMIEGEIIEGEIVEGEIIEGEIVEGRTAP